jgi:hypothetical protein
MSTTLVEIVVTVAADGPRWTEAEPPAVAAAAADAVDTLLPPPLLRDHGFRLLSVERIEPMEAQP